MNISTEKRLNVESVPQVVVEMGDHFFAVGRLKQDYKSKPPVMHDTYYLRTGRTAEAAYSTIRDALFSFDQTNLSVDAGSIRVTDRMIALRSEGGGFSSLLSAALLSQYLEETQALKELVLIRRVSTDLFVFKGLDGIFGRPVQINDQLCSMLMNKETHIGTSCIPVRINPDDDRWWTLSRGQSVTMDAINYPRQQFTNFNLSSQIGVTLHHTVGREPSLKVGGADTFRDADKVSNHIHFDGSVIQLVTKIAAVRGIAVPDSVAEALNKEARLDELAIKRAEALFGPTEAMQLPA